MRLLLPHLPIILLVVGLLVGLLLVQQLGQQIRSGQENISIGGNPALPATIAAQVYLARTLNVTVGETQVVSVQTVDWPDTSLGCPQTGLVYAQVVTPGYLVKLSYQGKTYEYHTDLSWSAAETRVCQLP